MTNDGRLGIYSRCSEKLLSLFCSERFGGWDVGEGILCLLIRIPGGGKDGAKAVTATSAHKVRFTVPWHLAQDTVLLVGSSWQQQKVDGAVAALWGEGPSMMGTMRAMWGRLRTEGGWWPRRGTRDGGDMGAEMRTHMPSLGKSKFCFPQHNSGYFPCARHIPTPQHISL